MKILIAQGAEAKIHLQNGIITKERINKNYRHPSIDASIRKKTTRTEAKILDKAQNLIPTPKILNSCDKSMKIEMEYVQGPQIKEIIDEMNEQERNKIFTTIGTQTAKLHNQNIIHGDLTTSNMIHKKDKIFFIDFGLGSFSTKIEDKAVDIHLLKQALQSKHHTHYQKSFKAFLKGYKKESKQYNNIIQRLNQVELRGRYKKKNFLKRKEKAV